MSDIKATGARTSSAKKKNFHIGGQQLLLLKPPTNWTAPIELPDLRCCKYVAVDLETRDEGLSEGKGPGWATGKGHVCGVVLAWHAGQPRARYFPVKHPDSKCFDEDSIKRWFKDHIKAGIRFVFLNAPYDLGWLDQDFGIAPPSQIDDAGCMAYMIDEQRPSYGLDALCRWRGIPGKDEKTLQPHLLEAAAS